MGILPDAYISKHEVFKADVQFLPPAVCLQYKIFKIFCVYTMAQRPNIAPANQSLAPWDRARGIRSVS